ncbi:hypothetical protein O9992_14865 [Vibrio lentus]|nr:hypothetical protein [Vibrio lentus]
MIDRFSLISRELSGHLGGCTKQCNKLKPAQMAGRGVTAFDITQALNNENIESPAVFVTMRL